MPVKKSNVKDLLNYRPIARPENRDDIDEVARLYRTKKMVFSMAMKTVRQLTGNKRQAEVARARALEYGGKFPRATR